jgi:hypothetical protein
VGGRRSEGAWKCKGHLVTCHVEISVPPNSAGEIYTSAPTIQDMQFEETRVSNLGTAVHELRMSSTVKDLSSISIILSAAHHRNKNQHRIAKWWKSFCILRRNLDKLITELQKWEGEEKLVGETKWTIASREVVEKRVNFMIEWVMPKSYV